MDRTTIAATRRLLATGATAVLVLGLALVAPGAAAQATPDGSNAAARQVTPLRTELTPGSYRLTLVTGDRVTLAVDTDQTLRLSLDPQPRADGSTPSLNWHTSGDGVYVVPQDAQPHLATGRLDEKLFDVEYLAAHGFTDDATAALPLIIEHPERVAPAVAVRAVGLPPAQAEPLASIDAAALEVSREQATDFWASVNRDWARASSRVERVWLDRVAEVTLDVSVPQIGTPAARAAGIDGTGVTVAVLDTGIDFDHPDVAGKVVASETFVPGEEVTDGHGHGTHVATTIAGTGAASGGTYAGVAPGADLVIGKVCTNGGSCPNSAVIAGMEWAVRDQGAEVVNLSLGGCCTDGTDPLSQAVNQLSAETGALFVIAAGNDGPTPFTVGSPGTADAALTVASVSKNELMAGNSSRGPRRGDSAFKPEIAAPGVSIVAGRAAGTAMGGVVNEHYTTASGTSMATPHVAGAAALLVQQHPGWDGQRVKAALIGSAHDLGFPGYSQGAGRVDIARAVSQELVASPPVVDFKFHAFPPEGDPLTRTLTYDNPTGTPVTLALVASLPGTPAGVLTLDSDTVTVPAQGTAEVSLTLQHTLLGSGNFTGAVVATQAGSDLKLTTPVGISMGEQLHSLTVDLTARTCENDVHCLGDASSFNYWILTAWRIGEVPGAHSGVAVGEPIRVLLDPATGPTSGSGDSYRYSVSPAADSLTVHLFLPEGHYALQWEPLWQNRSNRQQHPWLWAPDVVVPGTGGVSFDANLAVKVNHHTPRPTGADGVAASRTYHRILPGGQALGWGSAETFGHGNYWSYPTGPVEHGSFLSSHQDALEAPQLTMRIAGPDPVELSPIYSGYRPEAHYHPTVPVRFPTGTRTLEVVDLGTGTAAEYEGVDVAGKLVLVRDGRGFGFCSVQAQLLERALAAGAVGVLVNAVTCTMPVLPAFDGRPEIPYAALPMGEAELLSQRLADGPVAVTVTSQPVAPYVYHVRSFEEGVVPATMDYSYPHDSVMTIQASYHGRADGWFSYDRRTWHPDAIMEVNQVYDFAAPISRTEYLAPVGADYRHERSAFSEGIPGLEFGFTRADVFAQPGKVIERWNADPWTPGAAPATGSQFLSLCAGCREADTFWPFVNMTTGDPAYEGANVGLGMPASDDPDDPWAGMALYRNGVAVPMEPFLFGLPSFPVPSEVSDYRFVLDLLAAEDHSHTEWEYRSGAGQGNLPAADGYACLLGGLLGADLPCRAEPLIFLRYAGLDSDLYNRVPAPGAHRLEVAAYRQPATQPWPAIAGLKLWVSYNAGDTWEQAKVKKLSPGRYSVLVTHPPAPRRASDWVSIRAEAWDSQGNRVRQTLPDVYQLTDRGCPGCGSGAH